MQVLYRHYFTAFFISYYYKYIYCEHAPSNFALQKVVRIRVSLLSHHLYMHM